MTSASIPALPAALPAALLAASFALACQPKAREGEASDTLPASTQAPASATTTPPPPAAPAESAGTAARPRGQAVPAGAPGQQAGKERPTPPGMQSTPPVTGEKEPVRTVRELLSSDADVGRMVRVAGRCIGYSKPVAEGMPPLTRSDWQLEDGGEAIYVSGPLPSGCSATEGSTARTTIVARVAQDTMPASGDRPATPRRYLVHVAR
jgi:hypothetical protein